MPIKKTPRRNKRMFMRKLLKKSEEKKPEQPPKQIESKELREGFCVEGECSNPVAPGQNYVCLQHIRRG